MNKSYLALLKVIHTPPLKRKTIVYKRKMKYEISQERLNELIAKYFKGFNVETEYAEIVISFADKDDLLFLLRNGKRIK